MNLEQHENNRFTKEHNEIEKYLLRIIQRYFDIENIYNQESIEAIIIESLTRYKQDIYHEHGGFLFSLNQRTGHIVLTINDLNGEEAFEKQTAFNKDFGDAVDTICEGNDPRLEDKRKPLEHKHEIADITGLKERLEKIIPTSSNISHIHKNKDILNMIIYTGTRTQIDLIELEYLSETLKSYYENLLYCQKEEKVITNESINDLSHYITIIENDLAYAKSLVENAVTWIDDAYKYTDNQIELLKSKFVKLFLDYATKDNVNNLKEYFSNTYRIITDGEISIPNGQFTFTSVLEDNTIEASNENGDSLKDIYDNGLCFGEDDWVWDDVNKSFVYQSNVQSTYPMFISLNKFDTYTHRVTLASNDSDDDLISVVIAYDDYTNSHLSLLIGNGGVTPTGMSGATASIVLNYTGNYDMSGDLTIDSKQIGPSSSWKDTINGVTVLIKRNKNNIKIWINYNTPNTWIPEELNGVKDIYPAETPDFDFNIDSYADLFMFIDSESNYGYGCFSQALATYKDVYFITNGDTTVDTYHSNVSEQNTVQINMSLDTNIKNKNVKTYFRYDLNGQVITVPLPFISKMEDGSIIAIQVKYVDNDCYIETNIVNVIPIDVTENNFYDDVTIIGVSSNKITYDEYKYDKIYYGKEEPLCLIDSQTKNDFIKQILTKDATYLIQGKRASEANDTFIDNKDNPMSYFDWDLNQPLLSQEYNCICINKNQKWETSSIYDEHYMVLEYKLKRLSDYFDNPRIYYQIFGIQEVI